MKKILAIFMAVVTGIFAFSLTSVGTVSAAGSTIPNSWEGTTSNTAVQGGMNVAGGTDVDQGDGVIDVIKNVINYALGFLGLIALIMLLRGGFKIVTAGGDENAHQEGTKVLKNAAIGIAFIGIARFLVTFIFYVFSLVTKGLVGGDMYCSHIYSTPDSSGVFFIKKKSCKLTLFIYIFIGNNLGLSFIKKSQN